MTALNKRSSNYRKLRNLANAVEYFCENGNLQGYELFMFTDNLVAEYTYYKGTSSSRMLFNLILRLMKLEMSEEFLSYEIRISGTRMIECVVDTLSWGITSEVVMLRNSVLCYIQWHLSPLNRSRGVIAWVES